MLATRYRARLPVCPPPRLPVSLVADRCIQSDVTPDSRPQDASPSPDDDHSDDGGAVELAGVGAVAVVGGAVATVDPDLVESEV